MLPNVQMVSNEYSEFECNNRNNDNDDCLSDYPFQMILENLSDGTESNGEIQTMNINLLTIIKLC